jgi:hypothetical protein
MKAFIAISAYVILISGICGYTFKFLLEKKENVPVEQISTEIEDVQKTENSEERTTPPENVEYCSTCGAKITGAPYEAFARKYCDMRCYADDPDM